MKKSSSITLGLLVAVAMVATSGCNRRKEVRDCVDQNQRLANDALCENQEELRRHGYIGPRPYYWNYGGGSGGHIGDTVVGGQSSPTPGASAVSRGGFGSSMGSVGS